MTLAAVDRVVGDPRSVPEGLDDLRRVVDPLRAESEELLERFDADQLATITDFLTGTTEIAYRHAARLRAEPASPVDPERSS
ncbi:hypothetical protein GCM10009676_36260 [Prauserella halophila]|uniref:Uncharacterized protein n=1 Tax=Prauserella halophila TaxID=185641 RepID=A0ABP4H112_9PSEU|nr:hypothetical protein [Prauserella halophila]MCP2238265.1 hypothetical protein [Prauserella halophila]